MNITINNTIPAAATPAEVRKYFETFKAVKSQCDAEVAAGRFVWQGPAIVASEGDGLSNKVPADVELRKAYGQAAANLTALLDKLTVANTAFTSFTALVLAQKDHGYRPSFYEKGNEAITVLADAYDYVAGLWGLPEKSYRPERGEPVAERKYHLLKDFGVYKATLVRNFHDNDRGPEYDEDRRLLARRTQRYTLKELDVLFGWLWTAHDDCVADNYDEFSPVEAYTSAKKIERGEAALAKLEALKATVS